MILAAKRAVDGGQSQHVWKPKPNRQNTAVDDLLRPYAAANLFMPP